MSRKERLVTDLANMIAPRSAVTDHRLTNVFGRARPGASLVRSDIGNAAFKSRPTKPVDVPAKEHDRQEAKPVVCHDAQSASRLIQTFASTSSSPSPSPSWSFVYFEPRMVHTGPLVGDDTTIPGPHVRPGCSTSLWHGLYVTRQRARSSYIAVTYVQVASSPGRTGRTRRRHRHCRRQAGRRRRLSSAWVTRRRAPCWAG